MPSCVEPQFSYRAGESRNGVICSADIALTVPMLKSVLTGSQAGRYEVVPASREDLHNGV